MLNFSPKIRLGMFINVMLIKKKHVFCKIASYVKQKDDRLLVTPNFGAEFTPKLFSKFGPRNSSQSSARLTTLIYVTSIDSSFTQLE